MQPCSYPLYVMSKVRRAESMDSEFGTAVSYYRWKNSLPERSSDRLESESIDDRKQDDIRVEFDNDEEDSIEKGTKFSAEGPAPFVGDILEQPDLLWTEDTWNSEKEEMARQRIQQQGSNVSTYWKTHYEEQAGRYWHQFYQRNQDHFYKDRHYLHIVFPELASRPPAGEDRLTLLEVGCGVGNAALPLLDVNPDLHITAVDFAKSAVQILQRHLKSGCVPAAHRMVAEVNNIAEDDAPVPLNSMNLVLCMFVLSAMSKSTHVGVFKKLFDVLKPGGKLLMRDYGR